MPLDCWDREHHHCFDIIDKQTNSMLLVSTRISGLISSDACTEVKLSLMSVQVSMHVMMNHLIETKTLQESVEMLAAASGLDSTAVAPAMVEVAKLCGRELIRSHLRLVVHC